MCVSSLGSSVPLGYDMIEKEESEKRICPFLPIFVTTLPSSSVLSWSHAHPLCLCVCYLLSCVWLCNPMNCSLPGSSVHGILQARVLEWVAIPFCRDLPNPGIKPGSRALQGDSLPSEPPGKPSSVLLMNFSMVSAQLLMDLIQGCFFLLMVFFIFIFSVLHVKLFHCKPECFYFRCSMITF